ncbi:response regulator receiver protein [Dyadobacter fermentans DSM 18053]|uniref:Response regulator receiver protein n=2 Tax=Dyadobacter fermentans TaxID=94254 RepID=C6W0D3_DYAFD|nr:response regulator receiver protein [Dyadobacter fermentans DSM 18053]
MDIAILYRSQTEGRRSKALFSEPVCSEGAVSHESQLIIAMKVTNAMPDQSMKNQSALSPMKNLSIITTGAAGEVMSVPAITVYKFGKAITVKSSDITCLEGVGNYTFVYTRHEKHLVSKCLKEVQDELSSDFLRIHKSYSINARHIKSRWPDYIHLSCGKVIPIARRRIRETHEILGRMALSA